MRALRYLLVFILPLSVIYSFGQDGFITFLPVIIFYIAVPFLELFIAPDAANMEAKLMDDEKNKRVYDWILYFVLPIQVGTLVYFLMIIGQSDFGSVEYVGKVTSMGFMCGALGINVGHELGHRHSRIEQLIGELLLLTSLNTHFLPYHNGGHHRNVATPNDSATAARGEWLYTFWATSHFGSYVEAWKLENNLMRRKGISIFSLRNRMVVYSIANVVVVGTIFILFGIHVLLAFLLAAILGIMLLETVNYIEHYGLVRNRKPEGGFEPVQHHHSWNSDHLIGRAVLFNLSRHSDHHYNGSKKYQTLLSVESSPQMPTGYPGMMLLALFQPIWFWVMNRRLDQLHASLKA